MEKNKITDFSIEIVTDFSDDFVDYISNLCDQKSKDLKELGDNYTAKTMRRCFETGRFKHGFFLVKLHNDVIITWGLDDLKGWGVISRYMIHKPDVCGKEMRLWGYFWPVVKQHIEGKIIGLCSTHNVGHRNVVAAVNRKFLKKSTSVDNSNFIKTATDFHKNIKILDFKVLYRNTIQEVITYNTDLIPPFERYQD